MIKCTVIFENSENLCRLNNPTKKICLKSVIRPWKLLWIYLIFLWIVLSRCLSPECTFTAASMATVCRVQQRNELNNFFSSKLKPVNAEFSPAEALKQQRRRDRQQILMSGCQTAQRNSGWRYTAATQGRQREAPSWRRPFNSLTSERQNCFPRLLLKNKMLYLLSSCIFTWKSWPRIWMLSTGKIS